MSIGTILLIILILMLLGAVPAWPYSRKWGYYPSGLFTLLIVVVLLLGLWFIVDARRRSAGE